ncbi:hypothetical protein LTR64_005470 [Lithohypha guttulata]|uniref:uncharacterized protein n=1 Tax=Lithohypha guttulata TaxID=1690604 RepID=UPI002DDF4240|nr:hypothetical protein LTR51_002737 [Lithohypha guttulata]
MANKKKNKKPATNPARGFATVSVPSKTKELSQEEETLVTPNSEINQGVPSSTRESAPGDDENVPQSTSQKDIRDMTPDELEQHLQQAELQNLVEQNVSKLRGDANRQVVKLHNERRQSRQQADRAIITGLTKQLIDEILMLEVSPVLTEPTRQDSTMNLLESDSPEALIKMWTLQEVLLQLCMPRVHDALKHVSETWYLHGLSTASDYILGLYEAFLWYADNVPPEDLPDYETGEVSAGKKASDNLLETPSLENSEADIHRAQGSPTSAPAEESAEVDTESSTEEDDDENDPDLLTERWLKLQTKHFDLEEADNDNGARSKARKDKIRARIHVIERDILFDQFSAQQKWQPILRDLQIEVRQASKHAKNDLAGVEKQSISELKEVDPLEGDGLLEGMFGHDENDTLQSGDKEDELIQIHDFGKPSGVSPRRVLEDAMADLLERKGIKFKTLLATAHSARLQLDIYWKQKNSVPNERGRECLPVGLLLESPPGVWRFQMQRVATKSIEQSESFLAVSCLFLLVSSGLVSSKSSQRLPKVWRDMLLDLEKQHAELVAKDDVENLKHLRSILQMSQPGRTTTEDSLAHKSTRLARANHSKRHYFERLSPDEARRTWSQKVESAAFNKMKGVRDHLPVYQYKAKILQAFENHQLLIICADTGAGKSTQIPSYILEASLSNGRDYNIFVTQPRRISAISIARRVSAEMGEDQDAVGSPRSLVGYAIRLESKTSPSTRITFATTGVLLRILQEAPELDHIDCLVLDEVHERTMDLDLLFIALKKVQQRRPSLKIVLMSATVDATKFSAYFNHAPVLDIPGRTFPVKVCFLEDAIEEVTSTKGPEEDLPQLENDNIESLDSDEGEPGSEMNDGLENYSTFTKRVLAHHDYTRIDYNLIVKLVSSIATKPKFLQYSDAILIFMPGIGEIRRLHNLLLTTKTFASKWTIHMLHSSFSTQELEQAFQLPPRGHRKIVIATNIAETGITIPDITAVIDTCKEKIMRFDERRQLSRLTEGFIARASARQRKGRAARVRDGLCFHLVTRHRYETKMSEQTTPEMLRLSLQDPILRVKIWDLGPAEEVLAAAIDPPTGKNIRRAMSKLQDVGAIDSAERLTLLGRILAKLPLDVALGKMAVLGVILQCLDAVISIIASFSIKSIFMESTQNGVSSRATFAQGDSDFLTTYNAYLGWKRASIAGTGYQFCRRFHLSQLQLQQLEEQKTQLYINLVDAGLMVLDTAQTAELHRARNLKAASPNFEPPPRYNTFSDDAVISAVIAMALYPKILKREGQGYRNVFSNQQLQVAPTSINRNANKPPAWLCYLEASQSKNGRLNAFHSSRVSQGMLVLLLGEADFKMFSGVVDVDHGRIRLSFRKWRETLALLRLRSQLQRIIHASLTKLDSSALQIADQKWLDLAAIVLDGNPQS